jgi:hypothetical protein
MIAATREALFNNGINGCHHQGSGKFPGFWQWLRLNYILFADALVSVQRSVV